MDIGETMRALRNGTAHPGLVAQAEGVLTVAEQKIQQLFDLQYEASVLVTRPGFDEEQLIASARQMHVILSDVSQATAMSMILQLIQMLIKAATTAVQGGWKPSLEMLDDPQTLWELRKAGVTEEEIQTLRRQLEPEQTS